MRGRSFPVGHRIFPVPQGGRSISARGVCLRRRGVRRDEGIPPYGRPVGCGCPVSRVMFKIFVGEGHAPPAGPCRREHPRDDAALPYEPAQMPPPSGWCETQNLFVGAGFIPPGAFAPPQGPRDDLRPKSRACGPVGLRNAPAGAVQASSPTGVCCNAGPQLPGWPPHRRRPQGPAPQKQNTTNVPPCRISIAAARPRTAS